MQTRLGVRQQEREKDCGHTSGNGTPGMCARMGYITGEEWPDGLVTARNSYTVSSSIIKGGRLPLARRCPCHLEAICQRASTTRVSSRSGICSSSRAIQAPPPTMCSSQCDLIDHNQGVAAWHRQSRRWRSCTYFCTVSTTR